MTLEGLRVTWICLSGVDFCLPSGKFNMAMLENRPGLKMEHPNDKNEDFQDLPC